MSIDLRDRGVMHVSGDGRALSLVAGIEVDTLLSILTASQDCVKLIEPNGDLSYINDNGLSALEIDDFTTMANRPWTDLWPENVRATLRDAVARASKGERVNFEAECPTSKGTLKWWSVSVLPLRTLDGKVCRILASSRDITERVLRERDQIAHADALERELAEKSALLAQRDFLMREIDHRVKNSLAQVASILRLQARRSNDTVREALDEAARRVGSIARVHEQLQSSDDFRSVDLVPLLRRLCAEFSLTFDRPVTFSATGDIDLPMTSERATALSIIVSELVANAVRHGAGDGPVAVSLRNDADGPVLDVVNSATGPKSAAEDDNSGLGTMICETYAASLNGTLDWTFADGEMTARLKFARKQ
ncbi:MAG: sensor histidine kinase [Paracoccaceae bacterium]